MWLGSVSQVGSQGIRVVVDAVRRAETIVTANGPRWRRLCLAAYILWARRASVAAVNTVALELSPLAAQGNVLCAACVEYTGCFNYEDDRTNVDNMRHKQGAGRDDASGRPAMNFVVGKKPFQYLISVMTTPGNFCHTAPS